MIYVLYHSNCMDGTAARYAAWKKYGDTATYKAVQYNQEFPLSDLTFNDVVFILDFSYPREILVGLDTYTNIVVIDHHASALAQLDGLDFAIIDINKSGGVLAWEYFHPNTPVPEFLKILQDYDLWNWEHPDTKALTAVFQSSFEYRENMSELDKLIRSSEVYYGNTVIQKSEEYYSDRVTETPDIANIHDKGVSARHPHAYLYMVVLSQGHVAASGMEKELRDLIDKKKYVIKKFENANVAIFNTTTYISMMGHEACKIPGVDFSMSYFFTNEGDVIFSLRAPKNGFNVGEVAKRFGGGGHKSSAGFPVKFPNSMDFLKSVYECEDV